MTTYSDQDTVYTDDDTQVHRTEPAEQQPMFEPPVATDDYPAEVLQRQRFGGPNWGAGFFGWLVVVAVAVLLSAAAATAVVALGATDDVLATDAGRPTDAGIAAAAALLGIVLVSYFLGGYVAGRMSRFDGGKQGVAVWVVGLLLTGAGVGLGLLFGPQAGLPDQLDPSSVEPVTTSSVVTALATAGVALVGGLLAAVLGGKLGCRYHRKVDAAAYV
jgi:hypothetical protein